MAFVRRSLLATGLAIVVMSLASRTATAVESVHRTALLELYTSEGCNSCPPTDRWVSGLDRREMVPKRLVVLAFHVDYWNYLGWQDRFSQAEFTGRQHAVARHNRARTIYTPQLVLNGRDFRRSGSIESEVRRVNQQSPGAQIGLHAELSATAVAIRATAALTPRVQGDAALFVAIYENNLETDVRAGENGGHRLHHDYVVRKLMGPVPVTGGRNVNWSQQVDLAADWKRADLGIAAFVQSPETGEVFQATAQPLADSTRGRKAAHRHRVTPRLR